MLQSQTTGTLSSDVLVKHVHPAARCWMLSHASLHLSITAPSDGSLQIAAAHVNLKGEETAVLALSVPPTLKKLALDNLGSAGIKEGNRLGFDAACAALESMAEGMDLRCERKVPAFSPKVLSEAEVLRLESFTQHAKQPAEERDPLTGLPGKSLLLGSEALRALCERIPGEKVLAFLDFNNMGLANKVGLGKEVDEMLRHLERAGKEAFGSLPHQLVRLGGDEFAVIVGAPSEEAGKALGQFRASLMKLREAAFVGKSEKLALAEARAERRAVMRGLLSRYKTERGIGDSDSMGPSPFTKADFRSWVVERIQEHQAGFLPPRSWTGTLMRQLAEIEMEKARQDASRTHPARVMSFSMGAVQIGEFPNPEQIERGFDVAEKEIHLQKERYVSKVVDIAAPVAIAPYEALSSVSLRAAEATMLSSITQAEDLAAGLTSEDEVPPQSRTERFAKNSLKWQAGGFDPSLGDSVVRYNLRRNVPFRALFNPKEAQSVSAFILDVNHFGVLNNQLGYPRADALISRLAKMVQQEFPEALIVRKDGGKLVVITQGGCSEESLQVLRHRAELALKECVNDRVIAEYQMRVALDLWDTGKRGTHLIETGIRRVKLSQSVVSPDDSATLGEVMEQLEGAAQLRRHPRPKEIGSRRRVA